jgi:hypothetical protein
MEFLPNFCGAKKDEPCDPGPGRGNTTQRTFGDSALVTYWVLFAAQVPLSPVVQDPDGVVYVPDILVPSALALPINLTSCGPLLTATSSCRVNDIPYEVVEFASNGWVGSRDPPIVADEEQ